MYLSNLAAIIKQAADSLVTVSVNNKHNYQSSRSYILSRIKCNIILLLKASVSICRKMISRIMEEACGVLSIIRPDRRFGRYKKHTRRRYYNHMKSCI